MITLDDAQGLNGGLNRGLKISKMLKKNVRLKNVNLKNAIKVGVLASSFIPVGGGVASGVLGKIAKTGAGRFIQKVGTGKVAKWVVKAANTKVGSLVKNNLVKPALQNIKQNIVSPTSNAPVSQNFSEPAYQEETQMPTEMPQVTQAQLQTISAIKEQPYVAPASAPNNAQIETISALKNIPVQDLKEEVSEQMAKELPAQSNVADTNDATKKKFPIIPVVAGVAVLGIIGAVVLSNKKSN